MNDVDGFLRELLSGRRSPTSGYYLVAQVERELMALDLDTQGIEAEISRLNDGGADFLGLLELDHTTRGMRTEPLLVPGHAPDQSIPPLLRQAAAGVARTLGWGPMLTPWLTEQ